MKAFKGMNIGELKNYGHELIDEYMVVAGISNKKVYDFLRERMNSRNYHFGAMSTEQEVKKAIGYLKKEITKQKYEKQKSF